MMKKLKWSIHIKTLKSADVELEHNYLPMDYSSTTEGLAHIDNLFFNVSLKDIQSSINSIWKNYIKKDKNSVFISNHVYTLKQGKLDTKGLPVNIR